MNMADEILTGEPTKDHITHTVIEFPKSDMSQSTESNDCLDEDETSIMTIANVATDASPTQ